MEALPAGAISGALRLRFVRVAISMHYYAESKPIFTHTLRINYLHD